MTQQNFAPIITAPSDMPYYCSIGTQGNFHTADPFFAAFLRDHDLTIEALALGLIKVCDDVCFGVTKPRMFG